MILGCSVYVSREDQKTRDRYQQKCDQLNASVVPPARHYEDCDKGADAAARHLPRWYRVFSWPEGITTWAILLTLLVIADQTAQTRRAADATKDAAQAALKQAEIQIAGLRQWLDVRVTTSRCQKAYVLGGVDYLAEHIEVYFRATNQTSYPLTIQEISVKISRERRDGPRWEPYMRKEEVILPPRTDDTAIVGQQNIGDHDFFVPLDLDVGMAAQYRAHTLMLSISGQVSFKPVIGEVEKQWFGYLVQCGPDTARVFAMSSELKAEEETSQPQNPN